MLEKVYSWFKACYSISLLSNCKNLVVVKSVSCYKKNINLI